MASTVSYFSFFPNITISGVTIKDIFQRISFFENDHLAFDYHTIIDGQRPEDIANIYYGDKSLFWVILLSNGMKDYLYDWPLTEDELRTYINTIPLPMGETLDTLYEKLTIDNDSKKNIKFLKQSYLSKLFFNLKNA